MMTSIQIERAVSHLRVHFNRDSLLSLDERYAQLDGLQRLLRDHATRIEEALFHDLGKPPLDVFLSETSIIQREIQATRQKLASWVKGRRVPTYLALQPARSAIRPQPLGVVLVIAPWNYPLQLALMPLIGALAAGNCVVLKPSELAVQTSQLLAELIPQYLNPNYVQVITGGPQETTELLEQKFDHIFFTGSPRVGKIVLQAAAKYLTPCTLELGGKSPCLIDETVNLAYAAESIAWGKFSNAGQICIAPDYVLVHKNIEQAFLREMQRALLKFYGEAPEKSKDYGRIVSLDHHRRIMKLMASSGKIFLGGKADEAGRYIAPTVLTDVSRDSRIMHPDEEIFGPVLPVLPVGSMEDAIQFVRDRPDPLVLYLYSKNKKYIKRVETRTRSGCLSVNATLVHITLLTLPFGGTGASGIGRYHGKFSFDTFSHPKAVFKKGTWPDLLGLLTHPPFRGMQRKILEKIL